jgi:glycosyltransferase involved in cell wall biosynthesis
LIAIVLSQVVEQYELDLFTSSIYHIDPIAEVILFTGSQIQHSPNLKLYSTKKYDSKSKMKRIRSWIYYVLSVVIWSIQYNKNIDLIFATSNPPLNSFLGYYLKKKFKCPFIYMNWDLYPNIIESSHHSYLIMLISRVWHKANQYIYHRIDAMITLGETLAKSINHTLIPPINLYVIPFGTDSSKIKPIEKKKNWFCNQNYHNKKFFVLYSGKMGEGHNLDIILRASKILINHTNIIFVFIGHGPKYSLIEKYIKINKSKNLKIFPLQDYDTFPFSIACGDIGIVSQEKKMSHLFMPSKAYDMMAAGLALIALASGNDDLSELVRTQKNGIVIQSDNELDLTNTVLSLYSNRNKLEEFKKNSRIASETIYDKENILLMYKKLFEKVFKKYYAN